MPDKDQARAEPRDGNQRCCHAIFRLLHQQFGAMLGMLTDGRPPQRSHCGGGSPWKLGSVTGP